MKRANLMETFLLLVLNNVHRNPLDVKRLQTFSRKCLVLWISKEHRWVRNTLGNVIVELHISVFTFIFPTFENYISMEVKITPFKKISSSNKLRNISHLSKSYSAEMQIRSSHDLKFFLDTFARKMSAFQLRNISVSTIPP